ncbi:MAG: site-specific DNA-methyltransferase [Candidatus Micrarchaeota archaeon]|nr:site-specific DNA-methyltransferase [Candidatus Micrarchaeota archaeon]
MHHIFGYHDNLKRPVYNWFPYKEGFSWRLVDYAWELAQKPPKISDPFMGSGTTLLRAKELGLQSYGSDVSPLAYFVTYTKTKNWEFTEQDKEEVRKLDISKLKPINIYFELFPLSRAFPPQNWEELKRLRWWVEQKTELHLLALITSAMKASYIYKDGGVLKIRKRKVPRLFPLFKRTLLRMMDESALIRGPEPKVELKSALEYDEPTPMILTSPPYLNNIDYTKVYGVELALLTLQKDVSEIRGRMMSSFIRKKIEGEGNLPIKEQYFKDSEKALARFYENLEPGGYLFYNVSNSILNGEYIEVDTKLMEIMESLGYKDVKIVKKIMRNTKIDGKLYRARESLIMARR